MCEKQQVVTKEIYTKLLFMHKLLFTRFGYADVKYFVLLLVCFSFSTATSAQPTEAEIRKQITNAGTKEIKFTKSTGTRQWNKDAGNWEYVRGVEVIRSTEFPGIDLVVTGDVVYQYTGVGKYSYWKFRTVDNHYLGIPNPTQQEIIDFVSKDWAKFYGYYYTVITKLHKEPVLDNPPQWIWHSPNSVEFRMTLQYDYIVSGRGIETQDAVWKVRLYRDNPKEQWKNFFAIRSEEASDIKVLGMKEYTHAQLAPFQKQTLQYTLAEATAQKQAAELAQYNIPDFKKPDELVNYLHDVLRNGTPEKFRAVCIKYFHPGFFVSGSKVQLPPDQEQNLKNVITAAYNDKATYKQMYCQNAPMRNEKYPDGRVMYYISAAVNECVTTFMVGLANDGYKEGVMQTSLKIFEYYVRVRQDDDAIAYISSFSDRKNLCKKD